jgi:GNAT superfamily N-acetyltransferase
LIQNTAKEYGISLDTDATLQEFMAGVSAFHPPNGRIILAKYNDEFAGIGCLKQLSDDVGEIKRMFVRPQYRRKGFGKEILDKLIADARSIGYAKLRLDSPNAFSAAHRLYESSDFCYIDAYEGSEAAESIPDLAVYMELDL